MNKEKSTSVWTVILRIAIAVATAVLGAIGGTEAYSAIMG